MVNKQITIMVKQCHSTERWVLVYLCMVKNYPCSLSHIVSVSAQRREDRGWYNKNYEGPKGS